MAITREQVQSAILDSLSKLVEKYNQDNDRMVACDTDGPSKVIVDGGYVDGYFEIEILPDDNE